MGESSLPAVIRMLTDVETLRRSLRLYPITHPALQPARERIATSVAALGRDDVTPTLYFSPDGCFWNDEKLAASPSSPIGHLADLLFHLGLAAVRFDLARAGAGLTRLAAVLATLHDPPGEADREELIAHAEEFDGLELVPLDLSSVEASDHAPDEDRHGTKFVWAELAARLGRDGAFPLAGMIDGGEVTPALIIDLLGSSSDPATLFDHIFLQIGQILRDVPSEARKRVALDDIRAFLDELLHLLEPERQRLAIVAALSHLPVTGGPEADIPPLVANELLLDAVEMMLVENLPIPEVVQRALYRLAAPPSAQRDEVPEAVATRARRLLAQLPTGPLFPFGPEGFRESLLVDWRENPSVRDTIESLDDDRVRTEFVRVLREAATMWPGEKVGKAAALGLASEFVAAVAIGDLDTASSLAGVIAASRSPEVRRSALEDAVAALVGGLHSYDRPYHGQLANLLSDLGEAALPAILDHLATEESLGPRKRLLEVVARYGARAVPFLVPYLDDERWFVVRNTVFLLRRLGARELAGALKARLPRARPQVVEEILKALIAFEDPQWFSLLMRTLDSSDEQVREQALSVASRVRSAPVARALAARLKGRIGMPLREPFSLDLIRATGRLRDPVALPVLKAILGLSQWRVPFPLTIPKREAAIAIAQLEGAEAHALAARLAGEGDHELAAAVRGAMKAPSEAEEDE